jgi:hypothetical protein
MPSNHLYLTQVVTLFFSSFYSAGKGGETVGGDPMAQEIRLGNGESALLEVDDQAGHLQPPKHLFHIPLVLLHGGAGCPPTPPERRCCRTPVRREVS